MSSKNDTISYCMLRLSSKADYREKYVGMTGARLIYQMLLEHEVKVTNGIFGGANLGIIDAFHPDHHGGTYPIQYIDNSNEGNAGHVAEGYAKVSGKPGVILVTSGPGVTNIITPLQDAMCDGVPLIALSGQVATNDPPESFQAVDAIGLTKPCTKWNYQLKSIDEIPSIFDFAFYLACSGRPGPIHIDCPKDVQQQVYMWKNMQTTDFCIEFGDTFQLQNMPAISSKQLNLIVDLINQAERPVVIAGQGTSDCPKELMEFALKVNIPVATTQQGNGSFDERHALSLQMLGLHGHASANLVVQQADLIIGLGCRFSDRTVCNLHLFAPDARNAQKRGSGGFVHIDIRASEKDRVVKVNEFVHSDVKTFLKQINKKHLVFRDRLEWIKLVNNHKINYRITIPVFKDGSLSVQKVVSELDSQISKFRENCIFSTGVGIHQLVTAQLITWCKPKTLITSGSMGTMGTAIGFAIGAKLAAPGKMVIAIDGDGSFNMSNTELKTIMNLQICVKIIIMNNSAQFMVLYLQELLFDGRVLPLLDENCDYNKLAEAYSLYSLYCDNVTELPQKIQEFLEYDGPVVFNVRIRKTPCLPLVYPGKGLSDMILEDTSYNAAENHRGST